MSAIAIRVENLGKRYRIGKRERYQTLRDSLAGAARKLRGLGRRDAAYQPDNLIWALHEVGFSIERGMVVGVVGRNGSGKSTLLKILSRITDPTEGYAEIHGRVGSLLEVGTGFHMELSGRENIYLNGSILGMKRPEIERKFDEIVAFSEVDKFIDTPVKHYSSGMYLRLAFAVAAHLEPEILLVDEVLAVGDAEFQRKCLGKMGEVAEDGRTVLLVSHNMTAIEGLCRQTIWLHEGRIVQNGPTADVVSAYLKSAYGNDTLEVRKENVTGDGSVDLTSFEALNQDGQALPPPRTNEDVCLRMGLRVRERIQSAYYSFYIRNDSGAMLIRLLTLETGEAAGPLEPGEHTVCVRVRQIPLMPGRYVASFQVMNAQGHRYVAARDALPFELRQAPLHGTREFNSKWGCVFAHTEVVVESRSAVSSTVR